MRKTTLICLILSVMCMTSCQTENTIEQINQQTENNVSITTSEPLEESSLPEETINKRKPTIELESYQEGTLQYETANLHTGDGYSIYIPEDFIYKTEEADNILKETWVSPYNDAITLAVTTYNGMNIDEAEKKFKNTYSSYEFKVGDNNTVYGVDANQNYVIYRTMNNGYEEKTFILSSTYVMEAWDGFGALVPEVFDTIHLE